MDAKQRIARRVAQELRDGDIVNLGIGQGKRRRGACL